MPNASHAPTGDAVPAAFPPAASRREFLRLLTLASAAPLSVAPLFADVNAATKTGKPLKIIIAGAGLAGLCAAYELEKRGHQCVILEADGSHVGGRVRTLRLQDGLYGEAGAMRVPESHQITRHYLKELGVALRPFVYTNDNAWCYLRGHRARLKDLDTLKPHFALSERERKMSPADMWKVSVVSRLEKLSAAEKADMLAPHPTTSACQALDRLSLRQLLEADGFSDEAIELAAVIWGQEALLDSAATEHMREEMENVWNLTFDEIVGGTDRFATAFVSQLKSKLRTGCEIIRLEQSADGKRAAAVFRNRANNGAEEREEGDFLICTLPCPVLGRIETPGFSGAKLRSIRQLIYDSSTKVLAVTKRRFWETDDGIYGGGTFTDMPTATTYYPADNAQAKDPAVSAKPSVFLASYSWGQQARRLGALEPTAQRDVVLAHLSKVHPQLSVPGMVTRTIGWSWDRHPWSGGAFAWFNPGQHGALHRHLLEPEGRIHFAGEHASLAHTWMQGALESALRAVKEVLTAQA
ncbi:FAD-dependent oxidoreductase [Prosthecobacter sp.]|uniref:flavin monoamine oxidase family protein n=1 Tax=Prosthecobacter sp. TaxID=1965333 RepID=UPI002ABD0A8B|nr:FAD-dependent oxidoreductase [Prosthecobacter sp.]MDZ4403330.1 FAD-dependent oxidoreductase [Prosthecobacter sp.]